MAGNANFDSLLSTTLANYRDQLTDNIFTARPLTNFLMDKGRVRMLDGGTKIVEPLVYGLNGTVGSYSGYDTISLTAQEGMSAAEYDWKQYAASIAISGIEEAKNNGEAAIINLLEAKIMQAEESMREGFNQMFFSDGTGNSGKDWLGLAALVDSAGTVGGIDATAVGNEFWQSYEIDETMLAAIKLPWWVGKFSMPVGLAFVAAEAALTALRTAVVLKRGEWAK